jgi:hypothetical protein
MDMEEGIIMDDDGSEEWEDIESDGNQK